MDKHRIIINKCEVKNGIVYIKEFMNNTIHKFGINELIEAFNISKIEDIINTLKNKYDLYICDDGFYEIVRK